jgi:hypothetical protein
MEDYEVIGIDQTEDLITHFLQFADCGLKSFENVVKESK